MKRAVQIVGLVVYAFYGLLLVDWLVGDSVSSCKAYKSPESEVVDLIDCMKSLERTISWS
jgi:hypothetical protein